MEVSLQLKKSPTAEYAELLNDFSPLEEGVYKSNITPRDKALRSLAFPGVLGIGINAFANGGLLGYLAVIAVISFLACLISRPNGQKEEKQKISPEPRVSRRGRRAITNFKTA